jgi:hypothetical protein
MTIEVVRSVLAWCALINMGLLLIWLLFFTIAHDWMYTVHGKCFELSVKNFDAIHYMLMGIFKLAIILFFLVPYLVLRNIG